MDLITAEQFLENVRDWQPAGDFEAQMEARLKSGKAPEELIPEFTRTFRSCAQSSFLYIQYINELSALKELDGKNFIPQVAHLVGLVQSLKAEGAKFEEVFKKYDEAVRPLLTKDQFDTVYFDAIQGIDIRDLLKKIIDEVEVVLQSFSLVAGDLTGIQCVDLYENSVRFQLFLQYFLAAKKFNREELWSILFDISTQVSQMQAMDLEPTEAELIDLEAKIQKFKTN